MGFFADLTPYTYGCADENDVPALNVGWLDSSMPYEVGETSADFREMLLDLCCSDRVVHLTLGYHPCQLCTDPSFKTEVRLGDKFAYLGNGEIRVTGKSAVYAAPTLIYHYVVVHNYKPPDEFIDAVLASGQSGK